MFARRLYTRFVGRPARLLVQPGEFEFDGTESDESESDKTTLYEPEQLDERSREGDEEQLTQRLYELDRSSAQFPERLDELLRDERWMGDIQRLSRHKLVELIDYLDNVRLISMASKSYSSSLQILDGLDRTGSQFRKGLYVLQELCIWRATLPTTYLVSGKLSFSNPMIAIPGGYRDRYKGSLSDADICIKIPWMLPGDQVESIEPVSHPHTLWLDRHTLTSFEGILQGGRDVEVPQSPKYCALQGCHPQPPSTRVRMDALQTVEKIYQGKSACRLNRPREFIPSCLQASPHPILSCSALPKGLVIFTHAT